MCHNKPNPPRQPILLTLLPFDSASADSYFVIDDIMVEPDKALVTGHQVVISRFASLPSLLPLPHKLQHMAAEYLPQFTTGKVPTAIQLRFGKSDMGEFIVLFRQLSEIRNACILLLH